MLPVLKRYAVFSCALLSLSLGWKAWALSQSGRLSQGAAHSVNIHREAFTQFRSALPGYKYSFPRDHGAHPAYQTEWWYYTGHLKAKNAARMFGYQLTFFRTALVPNLENRKSRWAIRDVIFAHLALTDETGQHFYFTDRISRAALGLAGAQTTEQSVEPLIFLRDWRLKFAHQTQILKAAGFASRTGTSFALELWQKAVKAPIVHGENGVSQKSAGRGHASHYYSFTRLQTTGKMTLDGEEYSVSGESWFDHEFGSNQLAPNQAGWDWFSLQLGDGRELMLYQLRLKNGGVDPYSSGTLVEKNGTSRHLKLDEFQIEVLDWWRSPHSQAKYPARWTLRLPSEKLQLEVTPAVADQELQTQRSTGITYWEGSVRIVGLQGAKSVAGRGYVELTGYDTAFNSTF